MKKDVNYYKNEYLQFYIKKPDDGLGKIFSKCEILEASPNFIISGKPSIYIKMRFQMNNVDNKPIDCLGRTMQVVNNSMAYTIGLTGSLKGEYQCEDEFKEIMQSIKTGNKVK